MKILKVKATGTSPLLMHDDKTANPFNEYTKQIKLISGKRKKTEEDLLDMAKLEFMAGLYWNETEGYHIKSACFEATFLQSAKTFFKLGNQFKQSVSIPENPKLEFKHKKLAPDELFQKSEYVDFRTVSVQRNKIVRCRPIFREWSCEMDVWFDESRVGEEDLKGIIEKGGQYIGVADYRPKFGRFEVEFV